VQILWKAISESSPSYTIRACSLEGIRLWETDDLSAGGKVCKEQRMDTAAHTERTEKGIEKRDALKKLNKFRRSLERWRFVSFYHLKELLPVGFEFLLPYAGYICHFFKGIREHVGQFFERTVMKNYIRREGEPARQF